MNIVELLGIDISTIVDSAKEGKSMCIVLIIILTLIEVAPIKLDPWSWLFGHIGKMMSTAINAKVEDTVKVILAEQAEDFKKDLKRVEDKLDKHVAEAEIEKLQKTRADILNFANSIMNKKKHTKEQFRFVIAQCDEYEDYIEKSGIKNGVADASIAEIRRIYERCIQENSFLKEGEN